MTSASDELQAAIYTRLTSSAALQALVGNPAQVFDAVPEDQVMPYVVIDEPGSAEWDTDPDDQSDGYGKEHEVMIHCFSDYEGKKEINDIMAAIETELREFAPALTGHRVVNFRFQFADRLVEPDDQARHGVQQFRVITEETS